MSKDTDKYRNLFIKIFSSTMREYRGQATQERFADMINVARMTYNKWENRKSCPGGFELFMLLLSVKPNDIDLLHILQERFLTEAMPMMQAAEHAKLKNYMEGLKKKRRG